MMPRTELPGSHLLYGFVVKSRPFPRIGFLICSINWWVRFRLGNRSFEEGILRPRCCGSRPDQAHQPAQNGPTKQKIDADQCAARIYAPPASNYPRQKVD